MATVHIFGNSLAYGMHGREADWTTQLKHQFDERRLKKELPFVAVANHAGPGNMLVHSLESGQITANVECYRRGRQLGIFAIGACEACVLYSKGKPEPRRSLSDFQRDLSSLQDVITDLNKGNDESVFMPIYLSAIPVNEEKVKEYWQDEMFSNTRFAQYDEAVAAHADETQATYIDLRSEFDCDSMLAIDAIHVNEAGGRFVYEKISGAVFSHLGISAPEFLTLESEA